jgi:hypothetical protein
MVLTPFSPPILTALFVRSKPFHLFLFTILNDSENSLDTNIRLRYIGSVLGSYGLNHGLNYGFDYGSGRSIKPKHLKTI